MKVEKWVVGKTLAGFNVNTYIITSGNKALIIDPGDEAEKIIQVVKNKDLTVEGVILTHGHIDHIKDTKIVSDCFQCSVSIGEWDVPFVKDDNLNLSGILGIPFQKFEIKLKLKENDKIRLNKESLSVLHTPGHTPGGISLKGDQFVITGDTLFKNGYGRYDMPGGDSDKLFESIRKKLLVLPDDFHVYPGHGDDTMIKNEKEFYRLPGA
ncbi:MAG: MBL fold metallo-hydrolase [Spirochaetes bacterium]|nr:MBL fold metallo-hydrolase [Spirochaetota bacterium]